MMAKFFTSPFVGRSKREAFRVGVRSIRTLCPPPDVLASLRSSTSPQGGGER